MNYEALGITPPEKKVLRIKPNPKDVASVLKIVRTLNKHFYRKGNKVLIEVAWYAFMPWESNSEKKWWFLCSSLPVLYSQKVAVFEKAFRRKYPDLPFEFDYLYGKRYFDVRDDLGNFL